MTTRWLKDRLIILLYFHYFKQWLYWWRPTEYRKWIHMLFSCSRNKALVKEGGYVTQLSYSAKCISKCTLSSCHPHNSSGSRDTSHLFCFPFPGGNDEKQRGSCWLSAAHGAARVPSATSAPGISLSQPSHPQFPPLPRVSHKVLADTTI